MSSDVPAGWYTDQDPGQLRYWNGSAWTEHVSPIPEAQAAPVEARASSPVADAPHRSVIGYIGIALAVIGTVGVCTPWILPELLGGLVLVVGFVLSIVAVFRRPRWAGIAGIVISVIGTLAAGLLFAQGFVAGYTGG
ncbi:DUF2510 domain-containing protein [Microbacterium sp. KUDC0406]|uniref:DUF2510 domain-containing protein n=1 Tax=Microbacterium sp. KUDC0406 TaxID=2909588 RepID=UPI001F38BB0D|nr:DUF2510 domain-containing protein [Microbacterium sp. KUDC0406]UJP10479.1 DUF2510 domain-containing protein [Microbacterium sp. KUDC0406]